MKTRHLIAITAGVSVVFAAFFTGCGKDEPEPDANPWSEAGNSAQPESKTTTVNIGDVEQEIRLSATLNAGAAADNIETEVLEDLSKRINYVNIKIAPPYPDSLPLDVTAESFRAFPNSPAVIQASYTIDAEFGEGEDPQQVKEPLFSELFGKDANRKERTEQINALEHFDKTPVSLLIQVEAKAVLMPVGTDEETIDPATASSTPDRTSVIKSNPVRVDFVGAEEGS